MLLLRYLPCLALLLFFGVGMFAPAVRGSAEVVRVATYNVENYLMMDLVTDVGWRPNYPKPERSKRALREVIRAVNPDVLALQEMGTEPFLRELQRDLRNEGVDYPHAFLLRGQDEVRHVAVLSRLPFAAVHEHTDLTFPYFGERAPMRRGMLEIEFETAGERWSLFVVHLKSKWTERPDDPQATLKRTGEATAARNRILQRHNPDEGALYLIAGDFNDTRDTPVVRRFLQRGPVRISSILPAGDSRGYSWTHHWERQDLYSRIDFLLPSPALLERVEGGRGHLYDQGNYREASDHRLLWANFRFGTQSEADGGRGEGLIRLLRMVSPGEER